MWFCCCFFLAVFFFVREWYFGAFLLLMFSAGKVWKLVLCSGSGSLLTSPRWLLFLKPSVPTWVVELLCSLTQLMHTCTYTQTGTGPKPESICNDLLSAWIRSVFLLWTSLRFVPMTLQLSVAHFALGWPRPFDQNCYCNFRSRQY